MLPRERWLVDEGAVEEPARRDGPVVEGVALDQPLDPVAQIRPQALGVGGVEGAVRVGGVDPPGDRYRLGE